MTMHDLFRLMVKQNASDLFISVGAPPSLKIDGQVLPIKTDPLTSDMAQDLVFSVMTEVQRAEFELDNELNFAVTPADMVAVPNQCFSAAQPCRTGGTSN